MRTILIILILLLVGAEAEAQFTQGGGEQQAQNQAGATTGLPNAYQFYASYITVDEGPYHMDGGIFDGTAWITNYFPRLRRPVTLGPGIRAVMRGGLTASIITTSGKYSDNRYGEQTIMWRAGIAGAMMFDSSAIELKVTYGELNNEFWRKNGEIVNLYSPMIGGSLEFRDYSNRMASRSAFKLFPEFRFKLEGGFPGGDQPLVYWGFQRLNLTTDDTWTKGYSARALIEQSVFELEIGDINFPVAGRLTGGRFGPEVVYYAIGGSFRTIYNMEKAIFLNVDRSWGFDNSKIEQWQITIGIDAFAPWQ